MRYLLSILMFLPLAACFDADMTITFLDNERAEMKAVMTMSPEFYAMIAQSGDDACEEGVGEVQADGSFICTITESGLIDEMTGEMAGSEDDDGGMNPGEEMSIERLDANTIKVSFDLAAMLEDSGPSEEDQEGMEAMQAQIQAAFTGHAITMRVVGKEIISTNGTVSEDGTTASYVLPMTVMFEKEPDIPASFDVVVVTP
jgi:hypothetical protein